MLAGNSGSELWGQQPGQHQGHKWGFWGDAPGQRGERGVGDRGCMTLRGTLSRVVTKTF